MPPSACNQVEQILQVEKVELALPSGLLQLCDEIRLTGAASHLGDRSLPEASGGDVGQPLEVEVDQTVAVGGQAQRGGDIGMGQVVEQRGLPHAPLADDGRAFAGAGEQATHDLTDLLAAAKEAGGVPNRVAEGKGVDAHRPSNRKIPLDVAAYTARGSFWSTTIE